MNISLSALLSKLSMILSIVFLLGACAHARTVKVKPKRGGVIAVKNGVDGDGRSLARQLMAQNCRRGYVIQEEGEAVIGSNSEGRRRRSKRQDIFGLLADEERTELKSRDATEWRIKYKCKRKKRSRRRASLIQFPKANSLSF